MAVLAAAVGAVAGQAGAVRRTERIVLPSMSPGTSRHLLVHSYGVPGARPKAYLQASLHADELPPIVVLHHLAGLLASAAAEGRILGEVVLVPFANPIGLAQHVFDVHVGRFDLDTALNFNRGWGATLVETVAAAVAPLLTAPADASPASAAAAVAAIRASAVTAAASTPAVTEADALRAALLPRAIDADVVLDLHCDAEAEVHLYLGTELWAYGGEDLARRMGSVAHLVATESGGHPFDEACSGLWPALASRFPHAAVPKAACLAATVELRGGRDVAEALARADAAALYAFLQGRGVLAGTPPDAPALLAPPTPLAGVEMVTASVGGVVLWADDAPLGCTVAKGQVIGTILNPDAEDPAAALSPVVAQTPGVLFARRGHRLARPGMTVAKIAGAVATRTGNLLTP